MISFKDPIHHYVNTLHILQFEGDVSFVKGYGCLEWFKEPFGNPEGWGEQYWRDYGE